MIFQHSTFFHSANGKYPGIDKLPYNQVPGSVTGHIGLDRGPPDRAREDGYQEVVGTLDHINLRTDIQMMIRVDHCLPVREASGDPIRSPQDGLLACCASHVRWHHQGEENQRRGEGRQDRSSQECQVLETLGPDQQ